MIRIRTGDGQIATLKNNKWTCNDKATEKYLNSIVVYPEKFSYDPNPELTLADKAAILTEGKIIEINQNPASPNAIY